MKASVVIGANYGDEGKGHITDYLAEPEGLVVRFNGGAQAGHTVVTPDGTRHVFHHFGSGTFAGSATYLSRFFVVNPILFVQEFQELRKKGAKTRTFADPDCIVTTPYDMMLNQAAEKVRGDKKHGSCGVGVNETVTRNQRGYLFTVRDIINAGTIEGFRHKIERIHNEWVPLRALELGIKEPIEHLDDERILKKFVEDILDFTDYIQSGYWRQVVEEYRDKKIIFEGAQGLRLDEDFPTFPYVTRSKTGLHNVQILAKEVGITEMDVYYVTRPYITRHGAGPLSHEELLDLPYAIVDETNVPHAFQGNMRFAPLDLEEFFTPIQHDIETVRDIIINEHIALTCTDQIPGKVEVFTGGELIQSKIPDLVYALETAKFKVIVAGGPTRIHVRRIP